MRYEHLAGEQVGLKEIAKTRANHILHPPLCQSHT
jgi:hypothetical protein